MRKFLITLVLLCGCYGLPPATESAVKDGIAVNKGHMADKALPQSTKDVAQDNYDLLSQILYGAGSIDKLPEDTSKRMEARKKAKEKKGGSK